MWPDFFLQAFIILVQMDSEAVGRAVMAAYLATPGRSGKPRLPNEWTVLAAIVLDKQDTPGSLTVAALATGSKCLGELNQHSEPKKKKRKPVFGGRTD